MIAVYVDDLIIAASDDGLIHDTKKMLHTRFKMKDLGKLKYCLGIQVSQTEDSLKISQSKYINDLLEWFNMKNCNPSITPMDKTILGAPVHASGSTEFPYHELVGSLQYLSVATRPDITAAVSYLSRFLNSFDETHWTAAKKVLCYLKWTQNLGIEYAHDTQQHQSFVHTTYNGPSFVDVVNRKIVSYSDADYGGTKLDQHSVTGYVNLFAGGAISWKSQLQPTVALSTLEAEYMALSKSAQEVIWLRLLFSDLGIKTSHQPTTNMGDNQGCLAIANNHKITDQIKHINIHHHFIRERIESGELTVQHCPTKAMIADILTKPLPSPQFEILREKMGLH